MSTPGEQLTLDAFKDPLGHRPVEAIGVPQETVEANRKRLAMIRLGEATLVYVNGQGYIPEIVTAEQPQP